MHEYKIHNTQMLFQLCPSTYSARKVLTREGEHVYIVNADRWPRLAYIYSAHAFILALEPLWRERQGLVGLENVCPGFHGDVSSISNNPGGGESGYSSCIDLTEPRHGPSEHVGSTDRPTPSLTVTPITLCFPISCRFLDSRDVLSWQLIFFRKSKTIFSWN